MTLKFDNELVQVNLTNRMVFRNFMERLVCLVGPWIYNATLIVEAISNQRLPV